MTNRGKKSLQISIHDFPSVSQKSQKDVSSYLSVKSGVDSDLPTDPRACFTAYHQPAQAARTWTALKLLSVMQDVDQHAGSSTLSRISGARLTS